MAVACAGQHGLARKHAHTIQPDVAERAGTPDIGVRLAGSDAEFGNGTAVGAVQALPPGVYIAMNGRIRDPLKVRKNLAANRFEAGG
jgi:hypothetical protein